MLYVVHKYHVLKCLRKLNVNNLKSNTCDDRFNQFFGNIISLLFTKENILSSLDKSNNRFVCFMFLYRNLFLMATKNI